ncbi:MAG: GNAT family N-acetyltransferase [Candidatus Cloacimonetes bacterium HGW-Cloacimonetes-3]|jgi:predicted N-acetyltransferase YhbS|nr:MAG: GNAT family N-acetyltransferase [Candidatus Cloacimonetes bacterium HGW-Cloacimonetes-3]
MKEIITPFLRLESPKDYSQVEWLTREAFWNVHVPGCNEHYLAHVLRDSPDYLAELGFVAIVEDKIVGNIMYARAQIIASTSKAHQVITFGPVSVLPPYQSKGIGKALILHTMALASAMGHKLVVIYGDPAYYCRCGFEAGEKYGIRSSDGLFSPALQVKELIPGALEGISGNFFESEAYHVAPDAAEAFEQSFAPKDMFETPSQKRFMELLSQSHP